MLHQKGQQAELARLQRQRLACALGAAREQVQPQVGQAHLARRGRDLGAAHQGLQARREFGEGKGLGQVVVAADRKSTRLNSSHSQISYAVFCLKKKKNTSSALLAAIRFPTCLPRKKSTESAVAPRAPRYAWRLRAPYFEPGRTFVANAYAKPAT